MRFADQVGVSYLAWTSGFGKGVRKHYRRVAHRR